MKTAIKAAAIVMGGMGAVVVCGCGLAAKSAAGPVAGGEAVGAFAPVRVVVHPLSGVRPDRASGRRQVEAHIELFDRWDHPVKALGTVVFELYREAGVASAAAIGAQVARWDYEMTDPDVNARAYDPVTRTYRFQLNDGEDALSGGAGWTLRVLFTRLDGVALEGSGRLMSAGALQR